MKVGNLIPLITTYDGDGLLEERVAVLEKELKWSLPEDYRHLLLATDGGYCKIGSFYIDFWNINDIVFYAEDVETLDGLIPFASDGCGIAFAFDRKGEGVLSIPMDCLLRNCAKIIAKDFKDFLDKIENQELVY